MKPGSTLPLTLRQKDILSLKWSANASIRFKGELSVTALGRAVAFIMRRHEALRMRLIRCDEQLQQCIAEPINSYDFPLLCMTDLAAVEERIRTCMKASTNLETDGPMRAELIRLHEDDHVLLLLPHIQIIDDFSVRLLTRELVFSYDCYVRDQDPVLPSAMRYADYVFNDARHERELSDVQLEYWRPVFNGSCGPIPRQATCSAEAVVRGKTLASSISPAETHDLRQFASMANVSLVSVLYAIICLAVSSRYAADDIVATVVYSGRDSRALQTLTANTTRLFPLRLGVQNSMPLSEFARKTQATFMQGAIASRTPLFTSPRSAAQVLGGLWSAANGAPGKDGAQQRNQLIIVDYLYVQRKLEVQTPDLSAERVVLDPRAYESTEVDLEALRASPFGDGPLFVSLRSDFAVEEAGRPVTFVVGFYTHAISGSEVALLLERICDIARLARSENQNVSIGELLSRVPKGRTYQS